MDGRYFTWSPVRLAHGMCQGFAGKHLFGEWVSDVSVLVSMQMRPGYGGNPGATLALCLRRALKRRLPVASEERRSPVPVATLGGIDPDDTTLLVLEIDEACRVRAETEETGGGKAQQGSTSLVKVVRWRGGTCLLNPFDTTKCGE